MKKVANFYRATGVAVVNFVVIALFLFSNPGLNTILAMAAITMFANGIFHYRMFQATFRDKYSPKKFLVLLLVPLSAFVVLVLVFSALLKP